jgi:hypothetical protein
MKKIFFLLSFAFSVSAAPWKMHIIDNTSRGADGVRLKDVNKDGLPDIATGWEEGGVIRTYLNPGPKKVKQPWPLTEVGKVNSPEDAVFIDLDGDGDHDVVSCCEGRTRTVYFHWAPSSGSNVDSAKWQTQAATVTAGKQSWMFALPLQVDGGGMDLVLGSKGSGATIGWLQSPKNPRDIKAWEYHPWYQAGWIMSLISHDMDNDGDLDVLASDRRSKTPGVLWLENPGAKAMKANPSLQWNVHRIGAVGKEVMFITISKDNVIHAAVRPNRIHLLQSNGDPRKPWREQVITYPSNKYGTAKAACAADLDGDGQTEIAVSCEAANGAKSGVFYLKKIKGKWVDHDIGGPKGLKYDRIELLDLDGDGDLDLLTCEERDFNAVLWYENPSK